MKDLQKVHEGSLKFCFSIVQRNTKHVLEIVNVFWNVPKSCRMFSEFVSVSRRFKKGLREVS